LIVAAVTIVVVGSAICLFARTTVPLNGWTAYTPLASTPDVSMTSYRTDQQPWAATASGSRWRRMAE